MPLPQSDTDDIKWDWVETLSKRGNPNAAPISLFPHVPLTKSADSMIFYGTVAEYLMQDGHGVVSESEDDESSADSEGGYWFVKVVDIAGYYVKIEFLGYPEKQSQTVELLRRWVPYMHLKPLSYYSESSWSIAPPAKIQDSLENTMQRLYGQLVGKMSILQLREKIIQWNYMIDYKIGQKVEVRDKDYVNRMKFGYVGKILGRRVYICYWDSKIHLKDGIWCHADSNEIHLPGWSATVGATLLSTGIAAVGSPVLEKHQLDFDVVDPKEAGLEAGMYFEFVNPIRLNEIAAGKVKKVLKYGFFTCEIVSHVLPEDLKEYANNLNEFHYHITSPTIFPCGTCAENKIKLTPPADCDDVTFDWDMYLTSIGGSKLPVQEKESVDTDPNYQKGMMVEAVDYHKPGLVCPATIVSVMKPYAVKIRFLGWGKDFDQWKSYNSTELYPIGWCDLVKFPLTPPGAVDVDFPDFAPKDIEKLNQSAAEEEIQLEYVQKEINGHAVGNGKSESDESMEEISHSAKKKRKARKNLPAKTKKEDGNITGDTDAISEFETDTSCDQSVNSSQLKRKGRKNLPIKFAGNKIVAEDVADNQKTGKTRGKQPKQGKIEEVNLTSDSSAPEQESSVRPRRSRKKTEFFGENVDNGLLR